MKEHRAKSTYPFFFKNKTHKEMIELLNEKYPIKLVHNSDIITRVYNRYPALSKTDVSIVILKIFQSMRDLLILNRILNFRKLFVGTKLHFVYRNVKGQIVGGLKVKTQTSCSMK